MYTGSCLCGAVRYEIRAELEPIQVCHCRQCRKAQGTPFATNTPVPSDAFRVTSGHELMREFESSSGKFRVFCSICGSPIISKKASIPEVVRVRAGTINGSLPVKPIAHAYTAHKANWWTIEDGLPEFEEAYVPQSGDEG